MRRWILFAGKGRKILRRVGLVATAFLFALPALAQPVLAGNVQLPATAPIPPARPTPTLSAPAAATTTAVPTPNAATTARLPTRNPLQPQLRKGLDALARNDFPRARQIRDDAPPSSVLRQIMVWSIASSSRRDVTSAEIEDAMRELSGWPVKERLGAAHERAMAREDIASDAVVSTYRERMPTTLEGRLQLMKAWQATGHDAGARELMGQIWREETFSAEMEGWLIRRYGFLIGTEDHRQRFNRLLLEGKFTEADRIAHLARAPRLTSAIMAASKETPDAPQRLEQVPDNQRLASWYFAYAKYLRRKGAYVQAATILKAMPQQAGIAAEKNAPALWWTERRVLSRELLDIARADLAYDVASRAATGSPVSDVDADFHAGWIALRFLFEPARAAQHFEEIPRIARGPISQARGYYWQGRALETLGNTKEAMQAYEKAAALPTAFYGQQALDRLNRDIETIAVPQPTVADRVRFARSAPVMAIRMLDDQGDSARAAGIIRLLSQTLEKPQDIALLAELTERRNDHYLALQIVKTASNRGIDIGALTHPLGAIPAGTLDTEMLEALAYAVARQESEFNIGAVSGAGARGLLQLMPTTAQSVARKSGLPFSALRLTTDAGYNAKLGTAYLAEQLGIFDNSYFLTFAAYNAGPGRIRQWIERYGDPRGRSIDEQIDWLERIPFTETRNYVQRVYENLRVYQANLATISADTMSDPTEDGAQPAPR